jgi:ABC-2 type transport system permease protein
MRFADVLATELVKLRRSKVTWATLAVYAFMVAMCGFFLWMLMNPGMARSIGLIGQKANLTFGGQPLDWPTFMTLVVEMGGMGGLIVSAVIVAYLFGREYIEGTAKNMLALPTSRSSFVFAKIIIAALWIGLLTVWIVAESLLVGAILGLPGLTSRLFLAATGKIFVLALMSLCCAAVVAWIAVETRGYFAPLGFSIFTMVLASLFGHTGWGPWAPWAIVGLYSGASGPDAALGWGSYTVIAATFIIGTALIIRHEVYADNTQ